MTMMKKPSFGSRGNRLSTILMEMILVPDGYQLNHCFLNLDTSNVTYTSAKYHLLSNGIGSIRERPS